MVYEYDVAAIDAEVEGVDEVDEVDEVLEVPEDMAGAPWHHQRRQHALTGRATRTVTPRRTRGELSHPQGWPGLEALSGDDMRLARRIFRKAGVARAHSRRDARGGARSDHGV